MKTLVLASNNAGKIRELEALLGAEYHIIPQARLDIPDIEETGLSFIENAILKARHAAKSSGFPALADDSGLCVEALRGAPGTYSARYSGQGDAANNTKLLQALANETERSAFYVCVLAYVRHADDPLPLLATGIWRGEIAQEVRGAGGFGYDPIFYLPEQGCTVAELSPEIKNQCSHRHLALTQLMQLLAQHA